MAKGTLYVDGIDVYLQYGVYVTAGGWNGLVAMPPLKEPDTNDWQEEDGEETDLSAPVLDTRDVQVTFAAANLYDNRYHDFAALLADGAYHDFNCEAFGRRYTLRLVSEPRLDYAHWLGTFTLKLADDFPMEGYGYAGPSGGLPEDGGWLLDGEPLTAYGVRVLRGSLSEVMATPEVKKNLLRNIAVEAGAEYDPLRVTFRSKDVRLACLMRAADTEGLWRNWDALLYDLVRPGERTLRVGELEQEFACRYKSCSVSEFDYGDRPWLRFTLTLVFTGGCRTDEEDCVLAAEDGVVVYTEDGLYAIEMRLDRFSWDTMRLVGDRSTMRLLGNGNIRLNN